MNARRIARLLVPILSLLLLVLELLPYGVALRFALLSEESGGIHYTYSYFSYFSLTPWGYASFSPLLTALLSVALLVLAIIALFRQGAGRKLPAAMGILSPVAAALSLLPLLTGTYTPVAAAVTVCLLLIGGLSLWSVLRGNQT